MSEACTPRQPAKGASATLSTSAASRRRAARVTWAALPMTSVVGRGARAERLRVSGRGGGDRGRDGAVDPGHGARGLAEDLDVAAAPEQLLALPTASV